jgi:uncharacterized protein YkwD
MARSKRQLLAILLKITFVLVLSLATGAATATSQGIHRANQSQGFGQSPSLPPSEFARRVFELVNQQRTRRGCRPLVMITALNNVAMEHSRDMALHNFSGHMSSDGSQPESRMTRAGYDWSTSAENVATGFSSPESVVKAWMISPGHRANILNCRLQDTGVGYYYMENDNGNFNYHHYWTQDFAIPH